MTGIPQQRGKSESWLLTTATQLAKSVRSYATLATSWLKSETRQTSCAKPLRTLSITLDEIIAIAPDGVEDVYDIQVEGTESFIANGVVSHNTRWHQRDLIGRLLKDSDLNEGGDKYEAFEFPAIMNEGTENEKSIWPEQWSLEALQKTRASMHHIMWQWYAQYQQNPTASEAAIIKRDWIRWWQKEDPPHCDFIVQAYDTALTTKDRSDFSVCHTWGVWVNEQDKDSSNVILLNKVKGKYEFPELKEMAHRQYEEWEPDSVIVEAKASGQPLIDEMRRSGIFVQDFSPGKGQDKIARLNAVSDMFSAGHVWFPETAWASATVEEILAFPAGEHDDEVDAMTLALARVRKGGLLRLNTDREDNEVFVRARRGAYY
jgi:predicted phage terminase large subunit-like protein